MDKLEKAIYEAYIDGLEKSLIKHGATNIVRDPEYREEAEDLHYQITISIEKGSALDDDKKIKLVTDNFSVVGIKLTVR